MQTGGSGKAEGFADGEWANHRQAAQAVSQFWWAGSFLFARGIYDEQ